MKKLILTLLLMGAVMSQEKFYGFEFVKESGGIKEYTMTSNGLRVLLKQDNTAPLPHLWSPTRWDQEMKPLDIQDPHTF